MAQEPSVSDKKLIHPDEVPKSLQSSSKATRNVIFAIAVIVLLGLIFILWHPWSSNTSSSGSGAGSTGTAP